MVHIEEAGRSEVVGFIPTGWYPSAVALDATRPLLYIGNSKGFQSFALIPDRVAPSPKGRGREQNSKDLRRGGIQIVDVSDLKTKLAAWTKQVYDNTPYKDELLRAAKAASGALGDPARQSAQPHRSSTSSTSSRRTGLTTRCWGHAEGKRGMPLWFCSGQR